MQAFFQFLERLDRNLRDTETACGMYLPQVVECVFERSFKSLQKGVRGRRTRCQQVRENRHALDGSRARN